MNQRKEFLSLLRQVTGCVETRGYDSRAPALNYGTSFAGKEIRFGFMFRNGMSFSVGVSLGTRPIAACVDLVGTRIEHLPLLELPHGAFGSVYSLWGAPESAVAMLDPSVQAWILDTYQGTDPQIQTQGDFLRFYMRIGKKPGLATAPGSDLPSAEALASFLQIAVRMADNLVRAFDHQCASIASTQGQVAAQAWAEDLRGLKKRTGWIYQPRSILPGILLAIVLFAVALSVLGALLYVAKIVIRNNF